MPQSASTPRRDIYSDITSKLIAAIKSDPGKPSLTEQVLSVIEAEGTG